MPEGENSTYTANPDGTIAVKDDDGKEVRYVKEADLLAVKGSAEAAEKRAKIEAQKDIEAAQSSLGQTREQLLQAEAQVETLKEELAKNAGSAEEMAKVKDKLAVAESKVGDLEPKVLEYRRAIIVATFKIPPDAVKDKTLEQLDLFEDALKAVGAARSTGNYAVGGIGAGANLAGKSPMELARMAYDKSK